MKATKILAGMSAAAFAASMLTMVSASADVAFASTDITSVAYTITSSADTTFSNQYVGWEEKSATVTEGTDTYDLSPSAAATGFTNLGFIADNVAANANVDCLSVNGYEFTDETITKALVGEPNVNALPNIWSGNGGEEYLSNDGEAKLVVEKDSITLYVQTEGDTSSAEAPDSSSEGDSSSEAEETVDPLLSCTVAESGAPAGNTWSINPLDYLTEEECAAVATVNATVTSEAYANGALGGNSAAAGGWLAGPKCESTAAGTSVWTWNNVGGLAIDVDEETGDKGGYLQFQFWWMNANDDGSEATATLDKIELLDADGNVIKVLTSADMIIDEPVEPVDEGCPCGCDCTADTCDNWNADLAQCDCGCADVAKLTATLGYADGTWAWQDWASTAEIAGDGTYSIKAVQRVDGAEVAEEEKYNFDGATVLVVDIADAFGEAYKDENGEDVRDLLYSDMVVTLDAVLVDGQEVPFDADKIIYGNIENDKTNYRIEINNAYGNTANAPAIDAALIAGSELEVVFTVEGLGEMSGVCSCEVCNPPEESSEAPTSSEDTGSGEDSGSDSASSAADATTSSSKASNTTTKTDTNPATGAAALGAVGVLLAGAAMVVSKKSK